MKVLILGPTGLVGQNTLVQAVTKPAITQVIAPTRTPENDDVNRNSHHNKRRYGDGKCKQHYRTHAIHPDQPRKVRLSTPWERKWSAALVSSTLHRDPGQLGPGRNRSARPRTRGNSV